MKTTEYLYGIEPNELTTLLYKDAVLFKIKAANTLLLHLLKNGYLKSDHTRVNEVNKAIKFNKKLIEELA